MECSEDMDTDCQQRHLDEEPNCSLDKESIDLSTKQHNVVADLPENNFLDPLTKETSTIKAEFVSENKTMKVHGPEILPKQEPSEEYIKEEDPQNSEELLVSTKLYEDEILDFSQRQKSTTATGYTSGVQSNLRGCELPCKTGVDSSEDAGRIHGPEILSKEPSEEYIKEEYPQNSEEPLVITKLYEDEIADRSQRQKSTADPGYTSGNQGNVSKRKIHCQTGVDSPEDAEFHLSTKTTEMHGSKVLVKQEPSAEYIKEDDPQYNEEPLVITKLYEDEIANVAHRQKSTTAPGYTSGNQSDVSGRKIHFQTGVDSPEDAEFHLNTETTEIHGSKDLVKQEPSAEYVKEEDPQYSEEPLVITKLYEDEIADHSQRQKSKTTPGYTFLIQSNLLGWEVFCETYDIKVSSKDATAYALKVAYMEKYASEYSKELLFAVDVMTLTRYLNELPCQWIIYVTSGNPPISPCDENMDEALRILWARVKTDFGQIFESEIERKGIDYHMFQKLILDMAEKVERRVFEAESFLAYCMIIGQWAVSAERHGVPDAIEFMPLVICRTIENLKNSGKISSDVWEMLENQALHTIAEFG